MWDNIVKSLTDAGHDVHMCRSQTMDGAGNKYVKKADRVRATV